MKRREFKTLSSTQLSNVNGGAVSHLSALRIAAAFKLSRAAHEIGVFETNRTNRLRHVPEA